MADKEITIKIGETGAEITAGKVRAVTKSVEDLQRAMSKGFASGSGARTGMGGLFDIGQGSADRGARDTARDAARQAASERRQGVAAARSEMRDMAAMANATRSVQISNARALAKEHRNLQKEVRSSTATISTFGRIVVASAVAEATRRIIGLTDAYINMQSKLATVGNETGQVALATERLLGVAQRSRAGLESLVTVYTRTSRAMEGYGKTSMDVTRFTETLSKAIRIGGSTSVEASNAMIQLSQGMSSGTLRGDELRSVMEQLPVVAGLIAKEFGVTTGELKALGAAGKLTTDRVFAAIVKASTDIDEKFKAMRLTVADGWTAIKNAALVASDAFVESNGKIAQSLLYLADNFDLVKRTATAAVYVLGVVLALRVIPQLISGFRALTIVMAANPFIALATAVSFAIAALIPFADKIDLSRDGVVRLDDVFTVFANRAKGLFADIKHGIDDLLPGWTAVFDPNVIRQWLQELENYDIGTITAKFSAILGPFAPIIDLMATAASGFAGKALDLEQDVLDQSARRRNMEAKHGLIQDIVKRDAALRALDETLNPPAITRKPPEPKAGKKESGLTLDELFLQLGQERDMAAMEPFRRKIFDEGMKAFGKLKDSVFKELTNLQAGAVVDMVKASLEMEDARKLVDQLTQQLQEEKVKGIEAGRRVSMESGERSADLFDERNKKIRDGVKTAGQILDPTFETQAQIMELRSLLAEMMKFKHMTSPEEIERIVKAMEKLKVSLTPSGTFLEEMNTMFRSGGTVESAMANAAASAILFADSWRDVKNIVNDVVNQITHELLSSLIKLGISSALGTGPQPFNFLPGHASGGYTGNYGTDQVAGVVHGQEWVANAATTRRFRPQLEAMQKGQAPGGGVNVNIHNHAGVQVEKSMSGSGDVEIMISKKIAEQVPRLVAGQVADPTSKVSKSLQRNLETGRRRT